MIEKNFITLDPEKYGEIIDKYSFKETIPFKPYDYQIDLLEAFKKHKLIAIDKDRRMGISTIVAWYLANRVIFSKGLHIHILGNKIDHTIEQFKTVKFFVDQILKLEPNVIRLINNKKENAFSNGSSIKCISKSLYLTQSNLIYVDEPAFFLEKYEYFSLLNHLDSSKNDQLIMASSPNPKDDNFFHKLLSDGEKGENNFHTIRLR